MSFQDCFSKCILENFQEFIFIQIKFMDIIVKVMNKNSEIKAFGTKVPVCPWCGEKKENYEDFKFKNGVILCCKEDTNKEYKVIRVETEKGGVYLYNTLKLKD